MEIILVRHGRPTFELSGNVSSKRIADVVKAYNLSGVTEEPPEEALQVVLKSRVVVCSHLSRSIQSARAMGVSDIHWSDEIYSEVAMPHFDSDNIVLPIGIWSVLMRIISVVGFSKNGESLSMAKKRAEIAASTLVNLAKSHGSVLLVGHGFMNYLIARALLSQNWTGPSRPARHYWGHAVYQRADEKVPGPDA